MRIKNTQTHFGVVAIGFHWIIAFLIIGILTIGLYMVDLPNNAQKTQLAITARKTTWLILE